MTEYKIICIKIDENNRIVGAKARSNDIPEKYFSAEKIYWMLREDLYQFIDKEGNPQTCEENDNQYNLAKHENLDISPKGSDIFYIKGNRGTTNIRISKDGNSYFIVDDTLHHTDKRISESNYECKD